LLFSFFFNLLAACLLASSSLAFASCLLCCKQLAFICELLAYLQAARF
jgi:hypothetical protein